MSFYNFGPEIKKACDEILTIEPDNMIIHSIKGQGTRRTVITSKQASVLGRIYKRVVNNGKYVHHDWWT